MDVRIRCGSRSIRIHADRGRLLAWAKVKDLSSEAHFAMDAACIDKLIAALRMARDFVGDKRQRESA